ncbi:MAG: response regulator, partial [Panacagrimonas sp.]
VQGRRIAQFYVAVWAMLALGVVAKVAEINGLLSVSLWTTYSMHIGACLLVTLVSLGLADQINAMRREHLRLEGERMRAEAAAKSEFLAKMSHELRTPMNAIIGFTDLALRSADDTRRVEHLGHIDTAARSLLHILNDVLDLTRIESGRLVLESRTFEIQEVLDKVAGLLARSADAKGLDVIVGRGADLPTLVIGDALRIEQVLVNLLGNAVKFTEQGEVELRADLEMRAEERLQVRFTVRDSGIGIAPDALPRLFTPFSQADPSMTRRYGGSGLGLAVSRQLAELMGGRIDVLSEPGIGTECRVVLRLKSGAQTEGTLKLEGRRVLVAAANGSLRRMYGQMLRALGAAEDSTDSIAGLFGLLRRAPFDALLLDTRLREGNGLDALKQLRAADDTARALPVIVMTGHGREEIIREAIGAGANACLTRPIKPSLLEQTLEEFLRAGSIARIGRREEVGHTAVARRLRGARVLLVEDNAINRRLASEILREAGVQVDSAEDGQQAIEAVRQEDYDAVLMDLQMPVLDGFGATRAVRDLPDRAGLPIIAMTANAMQRDRDEAYASGMNDFLPKPIDAEQLLST